MPLGANCVSCASEITFSLLASIKGCSLMPATYARSPARVLMQVKEYLKRHSLSPAELPRRRPSLAATRHRSPACAAWLRLSASRLCPTARLSTRLPAAAGTWARERRLPCGFRWHRASPRSEEHTSEL